MHKEMLSSSWQIGISANGWRAAKGTVEAQSTCNVFHPASSQDPAECAVSVERSPCLLRKPCYSYLFF
jgi:hypothetical protein